MDKEITTESNELNQLKCMYDKKSKKLKELIPQYNCSIDATNQLIDIITTLGLRETVLDVLKDKIYKDKYIYETWSYVDLNYALPEIKEFIENNQKEIEQKLYGDPVFYINDEWPHVFGDEE